MSCTSEGAPIPIMPLDMSDDPIARCEKIGLCVCLDNIFVARLVGKAEIASTPAAAQAMDHEWSRLRNQSVSDENNPRDWADVRQEARVGGC